MNITRLATCLISHTYQSGTSTSEMSVEHFGFTANITSNASLSSATESLSSNTDPVPPPTKRKSFSNAWKELHEWLQHNADKGVMHFKWCCRFSRSEVRNQLISGSTSMKLEKIKNHEQSISHSFYWDTFCTYQARSCSSAGSSPEYGERWAGTDEEAF